MRPLGVLVALIMISFSLGVASPASADPPDEKGRSAIAHEANAAKKEDRVSGGNQSAAPSEKPKSAKQSTTTKSPGQSKQSKARGSTKATLASSSKAGASSPSSHQTSTKNGQYDQPQPPSNADRNRGGANGDQCSGSSKGPYCSTRDGRPSGNGQGVGESTGKPCAGCVGKADNKNPPGQFPDASDHNNGYECDNNNGIGKGKSSNTKDNAISPSAGNPAHTGCQSAPPPACVPTATQDANCNETGDECVASEANNLCGQGAPPPPGGEEEQTPPTIGGVEDFGNPRPPTVAGVEQFAGPPPAGAAPRQGVLPSTGATTSSSALATLGAGLLLLGGTLLLRRRPVTV